MHFYGERTCLTAGSISTSPATDFDLAASSGNRTAYETIRISLGFFKVSCILVETYSAASETSWRGLYEIIAPKHDLRTYSVAEILSGEEEMKTVI